MSDTAGPREQRYQAFISYSHHDKKWGRWMHAALETYRPPRGTGAASTYIRPVFRDDEETAASSDLAATIANALRRSDALVVICSPNSAVSKWVDKEIADFHALGKSDRIFGLIIDGVPYHPEINCFPPSFSGPGGTALAGPLAIDVRTVGRHDALLKIAAALLGVDYDRLKRRDRGRAIRRSVMVFAAVTAILTAYGVSLLLQTRSVNLQASAVLSALARQSSDEEAHGRALRFALLSARGNLLSPVSADAEPNLIRTAFFSTLPAELTGHTASIYSVAFDSTGTRLVSASQDHWVRFWDLSADGHWSATGDDLETGAELLEARFAEGGNAVVTVKLVGAINMWHRVDGAWTSTTPFGQGSSRVRSFDISPDGTVAIIGRESPATEIWRFGSGTWVLEDILDAHGDIPEAVAISGDARRAAIGYLDGTVEIIEPDEQRDWRVVAPLPGLITAGVKQLAFSASGERLAAVTLGDLRVLQPGANGRWGTVGIINTDRGISDGAFMSPEGDLIVTDIQGGSAMLWMEQAGSWRQVTGFGDSASISRSIASTNGGAFATGGNNDLTVRVWQPAGLGSWRSYAKLRRGFGLVANVDAFVGGHTGFVASSVVSQDGKRRAESSVYGIVRLYDVATGIEVATFDATDQPQYTVAFAENDTVLGVTPQSGARRDFPVAQQVTLSGDALIASVCAERMGGALSILTPADVAAAPLLRGREGEDVCMSRPTWSWILDAVLFLLPASS